MSPSENIKDYAEGWSGLMKLVRNGYSWSGGERNRVFLNGTKGGFHEMSHLAGLDQSEDGRGLAIVDWDQDGRLDLWYRNRSAPRLRLMVNRRKAPPSISITLEGDTCNRDAIGAVLELISPFKNERSVRSVKAGDLFLSQSSKWLHFGVGSEGLEYTAKVLWPGGTQETFTGVKAGRIQLKQGSGVTQQIQPRPQIDINHKELIAPTVNASAQILLPARIKFPILGYRNQAAKRLSTFGRRNPKLIVLWSGTCPSCKSSLEKFAKQQEAIQGSKLEVLALSTDGIDGPSSDLSPAYDLVEKTKYPFPWGIIDQHSALKIHQFQEKFFDRTPLPTVPLAILVDQHHRALAIYRGELVIATILADSRTLLYGNAIQLYHLAPPMKGTWFTNPLPQREVDRLFPLAR